MLFALTASGTDLYAGGEFMTAGRSQVNYIANWNGNSWSTLNSGISHAPISWVGQQTNTMTIRGVLMFTNTPAPGTNNFWRVRSVP